MKNKYQRMKKEEKRLIKEKYFNSSEGQIMNKRLSRLLIYGIMGIFFGFYLIYSNITNDGNNIWQYLIAGLLIIGSLIFIVGSFKIKGKVLNKYAIKNSK